MQTHNLTNKFDFHSYISRSLEDDFEVVIGIRYYAKYNWHFAVYTSG